MSKPSALTTGDFWIGDAVQHVVTPGSIGVVMAHNHARGLVRVQWESRVQEWVPPEEIRLLKAREGSTS
jgi:hypothetical protein